MSKLELDDQILNHTKFVRAVRSGGAEPIFAWLGIRAYVGQNLSNGFVPADMVDELRGPQGKKRDAAINTLCSVGLIHRVQDGRVPVATCERCAQLTACMPLDGSGLLMHDFLQWSSSREQVLQWRAAKNQRNALRADAELMGAVKTRDEGKCRYCGILVNWSDKRGLLGGTYDHVLPISKGGRNDAANVVVACRGCNSRKGNRSLSECGMDLTQSGTTSKLLVVDTSKNLVSPSASPTTSPSTTTPKPPDVVDPDKAIRCPVPLPVDDLTFARLELDVGMPRSVAEIALRDWAVDRAATSEVRRVDTWISWAMTAIRGRWSNDKAGMRAAASPPSEGRKPSNGEEPRWL